MIGISEVAQTVRKLAEAAARSDARVLITGETGVGKEVVAGIVHQQSRRAKNPFTTINCAGIPDSMLESELFGHVKGSFTGAWRNRPGRLEAAQNGTVFLDEIGEMSGRMQASLLRFLETGEIQRVGADRPLRPVDVRVIAATHRNLPTAIVEGTFREDLYYRLNVVHIAVPPLRDRREDVPLLFEHFLRVYSGAHRLPRLEMTQEALKWLLDYRWPGNVRELKNMAERVTLRSRTGRVDAGLLPPDPWEGVGRSPRREPAPEKSVHEDLFERLVLEHESFWSAVYAPFMAHELTRHDVRELVRLGLEHTRGDYRRLASQFQVGPERVARFMRFLETYRCRVHSRSFRYRTDFSPLTHAAKDVSLGHPESAAHSAS